MCTDVGASRWGVETLGKTGHPYKSARGPITYGTEGSKTQQVGKMVSSTPGGRNQSSGGSGGHLGGGGGEKPGRRVGKL